MQFMELTEEEFRTFLDQHPLRTFMQTPEMASVREKLGYRKYFVGVKKNNQVIAATMMGSRKTHFGYFEFYAPRGLLIDYENKEVLSFFTKSLKKYIRDKRGYVLRIDPYYITHEKDIDGKDVLDGINHEKGIQTLIECGYHKSSQIYQQFPLLFSMNLDKDKDACFKTFKTLPKRMIKKASTFPIQIREASRSELADVEKMIKETGERKHFKGRNLSYYESLYDAFHPKGEIQFLLAELDVSKYQEDRNKEIKSLLQELSHSEKEERKKELEEKIEKEKKLLEESQSMEVTEDGKCLLSAAVFLLYSSEVVYLFGGNKKEYMHLGSSYLMQWTMIQYGIEHGYQKYNFYGISSPTLEDGVYAFKRGFGGYVEELIGDYELPIRKYYYLEKWIRKMKR